MAVPKRKQGRHTSNSRRSANMKLKAASLSVCPQCGATKRPHCVCANCGVYAGREVIVTD